MTQNSKITATSRSLARVSNEPRKVDKRPKSWCPFCFQTHANADQIECKAEANSVHEDDTYWLPETIEAWRGFSVHTETSTGQPVLRGARLEWYFGDPGPAQCIGNGNSSVGVKGDHTSPHPLCTCGFHSLRERGQISPRFAVHAKVKIWGTVIEHEDGYRSERTEIVALDYTNMGAFMFQRRERVHNTLRKLRARYEVEEGELS